MPQTVKVSAPAKLIILGEHSVIYDGGCLVTAVDARLYATLSRLENPVLEINAPNVNLEAWQRPLEDVLQKFPESNDSAFIESCVALFFETYPFEGGLSISTRTKFRREYGIGSSSAVVAAMLLGLATLFDVELTNEAILHMGIEAIQRVQNLGSGADLAAAIYGGTIYYINQAPRRVFPLEITELPLLIVYSGTKAETTNYVNQVADLKNRWPRIVSSMIDTMHVIVERGWLALDAQEWDQIGELMNIQHGLLHGLGVDTQALSSIVFAARNFGAVGAKLSGAGGGDCVIVLTTPETYQSIQAYLMAAGFEVLDLKVNAAGVRQEA